METACCWKGGDLGNSEQRKGPSSLFGMALYLCLLSLDTGELSGSWGFQGSPDHIHVADFSMGERGPSLSGGSAWVITKQISSFVLKQAAMC